MGDNASNPPALLARRLGLGALILYGIGDVLGAGIYALVGKVAAEAGRGAWLSFLVSAVLAALTGLTYAEFAARVPKSAGAAAYAGAAFRHRLVPTLVGVLVLASGVTSAAAVSLALHGYLGVFIDVPASAAAVLFLGGVAFLAFWGIRESAAANAVMTAAEIAGLLLVIGAGLLLASRLPPSLLAERLTPDQGAGAILSGAVLAFFAFIGFEDLANLADESKDPSKDIPRAMLWAVAASTAVYLLVVASVLWALTPAEAGAAQRPLLAVLEKAGAPVPPGAFAAVAILAVANTGLANFVMASRLLYGMAGDGLLPRSLAAVHPGRRTPWVAVLLALAICLALAVTGGAAVLAGTTSLLLVIVFSTLHAGLIVLRRREPAAPGLFRAPAAAPWLGLAVSAVLAVRYPPGVYLRAALVLTAGTVLYAACSRFASPR